MRKNNRRQEQIPAECLSAIFVGRKVEITTTGNPSLGNGNGICTSIRFNKFGVEVGLDDGSYWSITPNTMLNGSLIGGVLPTIPGTRRIKLV